MQSRIWAAKAGPLKSAAGRRHRRAAIAAGASVLSAAAVAGAVLGAQPAGATTAAPAAQAAPAVTGPRIELQVGDNRAGAVCEGWHTASLIDNGHTIWGSFTEARAVASGKTVGTCMGQVREYVRYPRSETLTWSASAHSGQRAYSYQPAKRVYGTRGSVHYWTWTIDHYQPNACYQWVEVDAGNHGDATNGGACLV